MFTGGRVGSRSAGAAGSGVRHLEPREYLSALRTGWKYLATFVVAGLVVATGLTLLTPRTFVATNVSIAGVTVAADTVTGRQQDSAYVIQRLITYSALVTSDQVMTDVRDELGLDVDLERLARDVSAFAPTGTAILRITARAETPELAVEVANATQSAFSSYLTTIDGGDSGDGSRIELTLTQRATPPTTPERPQVALNLAFGGILGLLAGIGFAIARWTLRAASRPRTG